MTPRCVVLVPAPTAAHPDVDAAFADLDRRGYPVVRAAAPGPAAAVRDKLAADALAAGYDALLWVDPNVVVDDPDDAERLLARGLPVVGAVCPVAGRRAVGAEFLPGTPAVRFGRGGGLLAVRALALGFAVTRRAAFDAIRARHVAAGLDPTAPVPYFAPPPGDDPAADPHGGRWFCARARACGVEIVADTTVRVWRVGAYRYGWEDAGGRLERYADYTFHIPGCSPGADPVPAGPPPLPSVPAGDFTETWADRHFALWDRLLRPTGGRELHALEVGGFEGRSTAWLLEHVLTHPASTLTWVDPFTGSAEHAGSDLSGLEARFRANTSRFGAKASGTVGRSQDVLRAMTGERFDLIYLDGSHEAADVLADAVLAWPLLEPGGMLGFDDYRWRVFPEPHRRPGLAVDGFLACFAGGYETLHRGDQIWIRKIDRTDPGVN